KLRNIEENEFFSDFKNIDAAKYNFILAIEACIDICNHIVAKLAKRIPKDYADCFKILNEIGLIKDQEFVYRLMNMARFRNILVHFYWKVEDERLFKILKENLKDIEIFLEIIKQSYLV
ncbi:MAG: DUF86 domain-containing protein, partial [Deltaproteobacteria bacterium]|nr:DUF86 domain-containing protein [Deltaproteobacteria bacterium]